MTTRDTIGQRFDGQPNALNLLRLVFAGTVVVWHAILLGGDLAESGVGARWQVLEQVPVDGFFAISGFLIVRSWVTRPDLRAFTMARVGRLLPGLWVCLLVTAFVIVPLVASVSFVDQLRYVLGNAGIYSTEPSLGDMTGLVWESWNPSLWSLWWEVLCYAGVVVLGSLVLLRPRVLVALAVTCWTWMAALTYAGVWQSMPGVSVASALPRLTFMFVIGGLLWMLRDRVSGRAGVALFAAALLVVSLLTSNYHLIGGAPLAYLCIWVGAVLGRWRRTVLTTDVSYGVYIYGAPVTQALLLVGFAGAWWQLAGVTVALVVPLAFLSWSLVERPSLRLARRLAGRAKKTPLPAEARRGAGSVPTQVVRPRA